MDAKDAAVVRKVFGNEIELYESTALTASAVGGFSFYCAKGKELNEYELKKLIAKHIGIDSEPTVDIATDRRSFGDEGEYVTVRFHATYHFFRQGRRPFLVEGDVPYET